MRVSRAIPLPQAESRYIANIRILEDGFWRAIDCRDRSFSVTSLGDGLVQDLGCDKKDGAISDSAFRPPRCVCRLTISVLREKLFTKKRIAQDWIKLSEILDITCPMEYPYLTGTRDDGWKWGKLGHIMYWYFVWNMKKRAQEIRNPALAITNSVECNANEMLKQMKGFDFGLGIALFKYFGTKESQWKALKEYAENVMDLENL